MNSQNTATHPKTPANSMRNRVVTGAVLIATGLAAGNASATGGFDPSDAVTAISGSTAAIIAIGTAVIGVLALIFGINKAKSTVK